jgi:hypothetical protein
MKKLFLVTFVLIFLLSACNLPSGQATPTINVIATRVAGTLAAAQSTPTVTAPTAAGLPTVALVTATLSSTATETITPTPTTPPGDPVLTLGTPNFWFNATSSGDPFGLKKSPYDDDAVTITNQVDGIQYTSKAINLGKRWLMTSRQPTNFYLEGTFKMISCSGKDNYGLAMRKPKYDSQVGYYVGISCDGNYILDVIDASGNVNSVTGWIFDSNIKTGENQVNRLGVMLINDTFTIYINGVKVTELSDSTIPSTGYIGTYLSARGSSNFTVDLQELKEWTK